MARLSRVWWLSALLVSPACGARSDLFGRSDGESSPGAAASGSSSSAGTLGAGSGSGGSLLGPGGQTGKAGASAGGSLGKGGSAPGNDSGGSLTAGQTGDAGSPGAAGEGDTAGAAGVAGEGGGPSYEPGEVIWGRRYGDEGSQASHGLAVRADGVSFLTGYYEQSADFGPGVASLTCPESCAFLAKLDAQGQALDARGFGPANGSGRAVSVGPDGNPTVVGSFIGSIDFGTHELESVDDDWWDAYAVRFDENGNDVWARHFGGTDIQWPSGVASPADGRTLVGGYFYFDIDFGSESQIATGSWADAFVVGLAADADTDWSRSYGGELDDLTWSIAATPAGDALVLGSFGSDADFGDGEVTSAGGQDIFLLRLDPLGELEWSKTWGDAFDQTPLGVATQPGSEERVAMVGFFDGDLTFIADDEIGQADGADSFVALLDGAGDPIFVRRIGGPGRQTARVVAIDGAGNVIVAGDYQSALASDLLPASTQSSSDLFVAKYSPSGDLLWIERFGAGGHQYLSGIGTDADGNVYVTGYFMGKIPLATSVLTNAENGDWDIFLLKLAP